MGVKVSVYCACSNIMCHLPSATLISSKARSTHSWTVYRDWERSLSGFWLCWSPKPLHFEPGARRDRTSVYHIGKQ
jgi:hypothetical protein